MDLLEYKEYLLENLKVSAEYETNSLQNEFVKAVVDTLIDAEEFEDFEQGFFEGPFERNKRMIIDGCCFDQLDKSCIILISDFSGNNDLQTITGTEINKLYDNMRNFVKASTKGYLREKGFEESSPGYRFARDIEDKLKSNNISKFRFYIITDRVLSERIKNLKKENILDKPVELNVWDINRLHSIYKSGLGKESIEINFNDIDFEGISCVKAVECEDEYSAYLAVIPGDILAKLYIVYGSRLLEGNVRSFLSTKGKVNKNIRETILKSPEMFFAYNNGIAATATEIETKLTNNGLLITKIVDLQIINGGQTTASIANALLQDKKDLLNINVPMKLSVVEHDKAVEMIPTISRCANSQNKIDEADFFSNSPYHIRIEEYSRKIYAPAVDGNQYQTIWFYERARGQYVQEQMKLTAAERRKFQFKNPKNQLIKKVDIAKYVNTYEGFPHIVSKGAQANMRHFAEKIEAEWKKSDASFNEHYYKKIIALAIAFKGTENIVSNEEWYKQIKAYRANIVTYALAIIFDKVKTNYPDQCIDLKRIWNIQKLYPEFEQQLRKTTKDVLNFITREDRLTLNVTEWCKNKECWERAKQNNFELKQDFINALVDRNTEQEEAVEAKKDRKLTNILNEEIEVIDLGEDYWHKVLEWALERKLLTPMEQDLLKVASSFIKNNRVPSSKQAKTILGIREKLYQEGLSKDF